MTKKSANAVNSMSIHATVVVVGLGYNFVIVAPGCVGGSRRRPVPTTGGIHFRWPPFAFLLYVLLHRQTNVVAAHRSSIVCGETCINERITRHSNRATQKLGDKQAQIE